MTSRNKNEDSIERNWILFFRDELLCASMKARADMTGLFSRSLDEDLSFARWPSLCVQINYSFRPHLLSWPAIVLVCWYSAVCTGKSIGRFLVIGLFNVDVPLSIKTSYWQDGTGSERGNFVGIRISRVLKDNLCAEDVLRITRGITVLGGKRHLDDFCLCLGKIVILGQG